MNRKTHIKQSGFTLIEIMVVVVIIGILATLILPNVVGRQDDALKVAAKAGVSSIESALELYKLDNFNYPSTSEGLSVLSSGANGREYLKRAPVDPWKNPYQYLNPGQKNANSFDVWSFGSDGVPGGEGAAKDIGNWQD